MTERCRHRFAAGSAGHVANLLLEHHIHRVVVVRDENGKHKPVAVVSDTDLIYHMVKEIE